MLSEDQPRREGLAKFEETKTVPLVRLYAPWIRIDAYLSSSRDAPYESEDIME